MTVRGSMKFIATISKLERKKFLVEFQNIEWTNYSFLTDVVFTVDTGMQFNL